MFRKWTNDGNVKFWELSSATELSFFFFTLLTQLLTQLLITNVNESKKDLNLKVKNHWVKIIQLQQKRNN